MVVAHDVVDVCLLSREGIVRCQLDLRLAQAETPVSGLAGENIRAVCPDPFEPRRLYACSTTEVYRSDDGGQSWEWLPAGGLTYREFWTMAVHPTRADELYVGTLPAAIFVSRDGGRSFRKLTGLRDLPDFPRWTFPPPPHDSHPRVIALSSAAPDEIVAGIEEGGVVISRDRGETWHDISGPPSAEALPSTPNPTGLLPYQPSGHIDGRVHRDVHWLLRDPRGRERMLATTGRGTYRTDNSGASWTRLEYGIGGGYAVPIAQHPDRPERVYVGAAENGPPAWKGPKGPRTGPFTASRYSRDLSEQVGGAHAWVLRSDDGGDTWRVLEQGLPGGNPFMISGLAIDPRDAERVFATYTDGSVYASTDSGESWRKIMQGPAELFGVVIV
jgi:photosystem II stability/assembly factor-like uncharacterized protein